MIYEEKKYSKGKEYLRKFIRVMADMQKWDASGGVSGGDSVYRKEIYGIPYEYKITVTDASGGASVRIETDDAGGREAIRRQFELLEKLIAFKERFYKVSKEIIL
ncbi:MAG: hypothetical protein LBJ22_07885, partial [Synergistaceae bacterium]|nr:hypothetical protein [Synergistaceae bacterium]